MMRSLLLFLFLFLFLFLSLSLTTTSAFLISEPLNITVARNHARKLPQDGPPMNLVLLNNGINCLDGSSAGYYFRPASDSSTTNKFIIHLEGGGLCNSSDTCHARALTDLGSSKNWASSRNQQLPYNMLDTDAGVNPDFYQWNHIWVPYCSGDVWSGTRINATSDSWNLVFAGHSIVVAVLDALDVAMNLVNATEIILTGDSAGGIGTMWNIDYVFNRYTTARVVGVPQAGWFTPGANYTTWEASGRQNLPYKPDLTPAARYYWGTVLQAYYPPGCSQVNSDPVYCHNMPYLYPYIKTPLFIAENTMDEYQVYIQGGLPILAGDGKQYIEYVGHMMRQSLQAVINSPKQDGLWAPACLVHEVTFSGPLAPQIQGQTFASTFGAYYFQRETQGLKTQLIDNSMDPTCFF